MTTQNLKRVFEKATQLENETEKIMALTKLISTDLISLTEENLRAKEDAIILLGQLLSKRNMGQELIDLIHQVRPFLQQVSKAKAGKLVRQLVDLCLDMEEGTDLKVPLCQECIEWAEKERRTFLHQALQVRLMSLYFDTERYAEALQLGSELLKALKKMDDKILLVEVQHLESKVYYRLNNLQRSRAALTSARTTANAIYCPQKLQAALDMQSGILHAADERDFKTAYSYFYEAFEGYDSFDNKKALEALKYMLLSKIMLNSAEEVTPILNTKLCTKYVDSVNGMKAIAAAANKRSLADFLEVIEVHKEEFKRDPVLHKHLDAFYDTLLTQNLLKLIEPYSRVQIAHIAHLIALPQAGVEKKLSQMILDKHLNGILDQGAGVLEVYDEQTVDDSYTTALELIQGLGSVVDQLYHKAIKLT